MANIYNMADTWNDGATTFTSIKMNVTDTASASASLLMDLQVGGSSRLNISKNGTLTTNTPDLADGDLLFDFKENGSSKFSGTTRNGFTMSMGVSRSLTIQRDGNSVALVGNTGGVGRIVTGNGTVEWNPNTTISGGNDLILARDAAGTLAQRNGANAQTYNLYGTYTDASNYRRLKSTMSTSGVAELKPEGLGTGASGNVLHISGLPTSNPGPGILWNNAGNVEVGT